MVSKVGISARSIVVALAFWFVALPASAFTISLTVSGNTYNVLFTQGSFDAVNGNPATPLTTTPWWGDTVLANSLATALQTADSAGGGGPVVPNDSGLYYFASVFSAPIVSSLYYAGPSSTFDAGNVGTIANLPTSTNLVGNPFYHASVVPAAVPEIDGNAMAKALFILFTLHVWIQVRRNRRARG